MATLQNYKCPKCRKFFSDNQNSICCDTCENWFHLRCSGLSRKEFKLHCEDSNKVFSCAFCINYKCGKCFLPVFNHHNALCCENQNCETWYHLRCTDVSLHSYNNMSSSSELWFCKSCYEFPFYHLNEHIFSERVGLPDLVLQNIKQYL